ncbi:cytochrome P450 4d2-like [Chironomus tepperi]|uniref:cytochrome P450 4d2-like n=1 Tax=Chironomus tepperi TaxID=113505 RepID=UPI00391F6BD2
MLFMYVVLFVVFIFILDHLLVNKRNLELSKQFNGPLRLPLIGGSYKFVGVSAKDMFGFVQNMFATYSTQKRNIVQIWVGPALELFVDDYKIIEAITTNPKCIAKSSQYSFLHAAVGDGLLFSKGQKWFNRRRIITPTFHFKILEQFFDVFQKQNSKLIEKIKTETNGHPFNIFPVITSSVLNALVETAMGFELKAKDSEYLNAVKEIGVVVATRFVQPWQRLDFLFNLTSSKRKQDELVKILKNFTTKIIEERRKLLMTKKSEDLKNLDDEDFGLRKKMCLLDVLLQSTIDGKPLSNEDIQEEVDTFTFAGHDTTTNAICFTLHMIAKHPEVQQRLNKEIEEVLGDEKLTFKSLSEFKYLELVIKETLRMYPPAPVISRRLYEEVDFGDFIAPANANYNIALFSAFRNPNVFENPDEFIPERFLKELPAFAFIPFSAGQRNCIGQKFAMTSIKTNIINILRQFTVIPSGKEPEIEMHITLKCDSLLVGFQKK